ncbi:rhodanese-like domain-containing protein [Limibacillus halophilus]|jgi:rhodanese-related sulfurtransferase
MTGAPLEISVQELKEAREAGRDLIVLDIREPWELDVARLEGTLDIPMNEIPERLSELPKDKPVAVLCRSGARSLRVTEYLRARGYDLTSNVAGGILAWADNFDPSMTRY